MTDEPQNDARNDPLTDSAFDETALSALLDDELDARERATLERRIADAPQLQTLLDELHSTRASVRALPDVDAPSGFWDGVLAGPEAEVVDLDQARERRQLRNRRRWMALPSAAAAAVFVAVLVVPHPTRATPKLSTVTESHAERSSVQNDPISNLAPVSADPAP